jgi:hypothetical protein
VTPAGRCRPALMTLIAAGLLVGAFAAGCSNRDKFELAVRARDVVEWGTRPHTGCILNPVELPATPESPSRRGTRCSFQSSEHLWSGDDGRQAVVATRAVILYFTAPTYGQVNCGGRSIAGVWWYTLLPDRTPDAGVVEMLTDEGSTIALDMEEGVWASGALDRCSELSGTWRGIAGNLRNRTGTYTMVDDSVQSVLRIVED